MLANVDVLHGSAESLLTVTNVLLVLGLREGLRALDDTRAPQPNVGLWAASAAVVAGECAPPLTPRCPSPVRCTALRLALPSRGLVERVASTPPQPRTPHTSCREALLPLPHPVSRGVAATVGAHATGLDTAAAASLGWEPANALSLPTWAIHVSSVTEWWLAMTLVWKYAEAAQLPRWKNLTWAMVRSERYHTTRRDSGV